MKRVITIIVLLCYLIPSFGLSVSAHYCGGKIRSISLTSSKPPHCCGTKKMKPGCCKDKVCTFKINDASQSVSSSTIIPYKIELSNSLFCIVTSLAFNSHIISGPLPFYNHYPPLGSRQPLYLSNKVFRI